MSARQVFPLDGDGVPAMCDRCGTVRGYGGRQEWFAFLKCVECRTRTRHAIVRGDRQDHAGLVLEAEEARARGQLAQLLRLHDAYRRLGFTLSRPAVRPDLTVWVAGCVAIEEVDGRLEATAHPETSVRDELRCLRGLLDQFLSDGIAKGWVYLPAKQAGQVGA